MIRKGKKKPPASRRREEQAASPAADARKIPNESPDSIGGEEAPSARPFGPWDWLLAAALVLAVFLAYRPVWHGGFLFDDDTHLLNNPVLKPGGLARIWVPGGYINYWPLTFTAYWLQFKMWGLNPIDFHLVNIAVHSVSALLLWRILVRLRVSGAMFAAAIFALHPVNVESVAWISQLKGLLSLMLALVSVLFFLACERRGGWWRWALAIGAFALSTLAKGMVITLPLVLLACAWWQRGRIARRDLLRVLPYLLIGAVMAATEVWTQHLVGAGAAVRSDGLLSRAAVAGCAVWFYFWKVIWPLDLRFIYPRWPIESWNVLSYLPGAVLVILLGLAWRRRDAWGRPIVMLIVCYVGLLLPALGFVNIYFMLYSLVSDHWQYAAMIVPCAVFAGATATLCRRRQASEVGWAELASPTSGLLVGLATMLRMVPSAHPTATHAPKSPRIVQGCLGLALLAALAVLTWRQSRLYADSETLYRTTIERNPACWMAHNNLGEVLTDSGRLDEAITQYRKALEIKPDFDVAHINLGAMLARRGEVDEAMVHYRKALETRPDYALAHVDLGSALAGRGEVDEAIAHYRKALEIKPDYAEAHDRLGNELAGRGELDEAIAHFRKALEIRPDDAEVHYNLGNALAGRGKVDEAIAHFRKALEIKPDYADACNNLALALARRGEFDEAIAHFRKALEIKPDFDLAHINLGAVLADRGEVDEAMAHYQKALELATRENKQALADVIRARIRPHQPVAPAGRAP
jgi:tetratricopeptide (TPR) repeat protein